MRTRFLMISSYSCGSTPPPSRSLAQPCGAVWAALASPPGGCARVPPVPTGRTGQLAQLASGEHFADLVDMQAQRIRPVAQWHRLISPENGVRTVEARIPLRSRAHDAPGLVGSQERHWWRGFASPPVL